MISNFIINSMASFPVSCARSGELFFYEARKRTWDPTRRDHDHQQQRTSVL